MKLFGYGLEINLIRASLPEKYKSLAGTKTQQLDKETIEKYDAELGYAMEIDGKSMYTNEFIEALKRELNDEKSLLEFFGKQGITENNKADKLFLYKVDFLAKFLRNHVTRPLEYSELIKYHRMVRREVFSEEENGNICDFGIYNQRQENSEILPIMCVKIGADTTPVSRQYKFYVYDKNSKCYKDIDINDLEEKLIAPGARVTHGMNSGIVVHLLYARARDSMELY